MQATIIGGGIAGPVLASFLNRAGITSVVCEARPEPTGEEGGFLGVAPNGMRVLRELGVDAEVEAIGVPCHGFRFLNSRGQTVGTIDRTRDLEEHGARPVMVKRGALHQALLDEARRRGVTVRFGAKLDAIDTEGGVTARFEDGSVERSDVLVGCDGLRSRVRSLLFEDAPEPAFTGLLDFGGYAPVTGALTELEVGWNVMVFGCRAFFGAFRTPSTAVGPGEVWWFHNGGDRDAVRTMRPEERRSRIVEAHAGDPAWIAACVEATPEILGPWPIHEVGLLDRWHRGRVGVIGDAAHATSPSAGQGASMAMEDAMLLARCLRDQGDPDAAFTELEHLRRDRIADLVRQSRRNSSPKAMPGPVAAWFRDRLLPLFLRLGARAQHRAYAYRLAWET